MLEPYTWGLQRSRGVKLTISPLILPFDQLCHICIKLGYCFSGMIKARASGSKVYLYFMKKSRQARHRIPRNSCCLSDLVFAPFSLYQPPPDKSNTVREYYLATGVYCPACGAVVNRSYKLP